MFLYCNLVFNSILSPRSKNYSYFNCCWCGIVALLEHCRMPSSVYYQYTCTFFQSQERGCDADIACGVPSGCAVPRLATTNRPATPGIPIKATTTLKTHLSFEWKFPKNNSAKRTTAKLSALYIAVANYRRMDQLYILYCHLSGFSVVNFYKVTFYMVTFYMVTFCTETEFKRH